MSITTTPITPDIDLYLEQMFSNEDDLLRQLRIDAEQQGIPSISIGAVQAQFLSVYLRSMNAKRGIEIGSLAGYSAITLLRALPTDGHLYCYERNPEYAMFLENQIAKAGFTNNTTIVVGNATETLAQFPEQETVDFIFIDANKEAYADYVLQTFPFLKKGGVVIADNTLAWGDIAKNDVSKTVASLQKFNTFMKEHQGFLTTLVPLGDGMTIGVKL